MRLTRRGKLVRTFTVLAVVGVLVSYAVDREEAPETAPAALAVATPLIPTAYPLLRSETLERASRAVVRSPKEEPTAKPTPKPTKKAVAEPAPTRKAAPADPKAFAKVFMATEYGWNSGQFSCLERLWTRESNWRWNADNPSSSAYGIPQALPGSKMASMGDDWKTNPKTQIRWGLRYIDGRYGTPCGAWSAFQNKGWY